MQNNQIVESIFLRRNDNVDLFFILNFPFNSHCGPVVVLHITTEFSVFDLVSANSDICSNLIVVCPRKNKQKRWKSLFSYNSHAGCFHFSAHGQFISHCAELLQVTCIAVRRRVYQCIMPMYWHNLLLLSHEWSCIQFMCVTTRNCLNSAIDV